MKKIITSESVTEGHPDKICDKVSDKILDTALEIDKDSKMAVECTIKDDIIFIYGEATTTAILDYERIAKEVLKDIGYEEEYKVIVKVSKQSKEINQAVCKKEISAGDQGIMFGYATNETEEYMPLPILLANKLTMQLTKVRKEDKDSPLKPDGKSQVTVEYVDGKPSRIHTILLSTQHNPSINGVEDNQKVQEIINSDLRKHVIDYVFASESIKPDANTIILINPSGRFVIGGPQGDSGLTGRKIIVDTYGGYSRHGGGAFSGKDPTKVDRSAAYASRYVAKNIVASGLAEKCEIELAYAIGVAEPVSIMVDTFGTGKISDDEISELVSKNFDLRPAAIIKHFDLRNLPSKNGGKFYQLLAAYGHMGRTDIDVPWEHTDKAETLKSQACACGCAL